MTPALHVERYLPAATGAAGVLPVVLLHGWGMNLRVFDRLREQLATHETWAVDLPGHGQSRWWPEAADFNAQCAAVLAALPPRCLLVGWSFGAMLAMQLATGHASRVAALALLAATPKFTRAADWPHGVDPETIQHLRAMLAEDWQRILNDFVWLQVRGSRDAEAAGQVIEAALSRHGAPQPDALLAGLALLESVDLRSIVAGIGQPTLVVSGINDRVTPPGAGRWLVESLPRAQLLEVQRAGHAPFISHHVEVAAALRELLE